MYLPAWLKTVAAQSSKLWLVLAFIMVTGLGFEAGLLKGKTQAPEPLKVTVPATLVSPMIPLRSAVEVPATSAAVTSSDSVPSTACAFVGSKNSNKYHVPTTRCAKQIKPANQVCFDSVESAAAKGYIVGCLK